MKNESLFNFINSSGIFLVSFLQNKKIKSGCDVLTEFIIIESNKNINKLKKIKNYFDCGKIQISTRSLNKRGRISKKYKKEFFVNNRDDLIKKVLPILTAINKDKKVFSEEFVENFIIFKKIIDMINKEIHLDKMGINQIFRNASKMKYPPARCLIKK